MVLLMELVRSVQVPARVSGPVWTTLWRPLRRDCATDSHTVQIIHISINKGLIILARGMHLFERQIANAPADGGDTTKAIAVPVPAS
jgi:hypothetical protein